MRRIVLAVSVIFLLAGFILIASSNVSVINFDETVLDHKENAREISGYFDNGEKIIVKFWPAHEWREVPMEPPTKDVNYPHLFLYFNVTGPQNDNASFEVAIVRLAFNTTPYVDQIKVLDAGSLKVSMQSNNQTKEIGGVVNHSGNYTAVIVGTFPHAALPQSLTLYKGIPQKIYPYASHIPIGSTMLIFGSVLLIWSRRSLKKQKFHKRSISKH